ncbi:hypothetical protein [Cytobacillus depressus]|nr:hypothetical protein [Cytobacillus depressus]
MSAIHIALLGYGTVGKGVYKTIQSHQKKLQALLGKEDKNRWNSCEKYK